MASEAHLYVLDPPSVPFYGAQVGWSRDRENVLTTPRVAEDCPRCGGWAAEASGDDPLAGWLLSVRYCETCTRASREGMPGMVCDPNLDVLRAYGLLGGPAPDADRGGLKGGVGARAKGGKGKAGRKAS